MKYVIGCYLILLVVAYFWYNGEGTLSKQPRKKTNKDKHTKFKLSKTNVVVRGLVSEEMVVSDVLENHKKYCNLEKTTRHFTSGQVLAYVTPWNSHGYDVAKTFGKFSMLSPVWLQIKRKPRGKYHVAGTHDIDRTWMKEARITNPDVQILPRILFDGWSPSDYKALFGSEDEVEDLIDAMVKVLVEEGMDGAVIEIWSQLPSKKRNKDAIHLISHMSDTFRSRDLTLIFVIPPSINFEGKTTSFTEEHFAQLAPLVDGFSLMTYDFPAGSGKSGPNAPLSWMKSCVETLDPDRNHRSKILLGMNFYGYIYSSQGGSPVVGHEYVNLLSLYPSEFIWEPTVGEHIIQQNVTSSHRNFIMFPTLKSIQKRLELAKELGTGIAIWEIGQGLDYFYDLL